jgi:transposase
LRYFVSLFCSREKQVTRYAILPLSDAEKATLVKLVKKDPNWRVRERARTVLLLAQGKTGQQVGAEQQLSRQTVGSTRQRWIQSGLDGLADRPRSGAPSKLSVTEIERLLQWAREEPLTLTTLKARHEQAGGRVVHINTLTAHLKAGRFVWKRTRHSLKKNETTGRLSKHNKRLPT